DYFFPKIETSYSRNEDWQQTQNVLSIYSERDSGPSTILLIITYCIFLKISN
ncbi:MAG: hypothetical protein ACI97P_002352, partial [Arcticibacterium sp.]